MSITKHFTVTCTTNRYGGKWIVTRVRDGKVMTEGSVHTCCRWISVWGPMHQ